jgi:hypothetical protein
LGGGDLTDAECRIIDPLLPDRGERGPPNSDKRRTVNGILWVPRTGASWRDMPARWSRLGLAIVFDWLCAVRFRRDDRLDAALFQIIADRVGIVALLAQELLRPRLAQLHQRIVAFDLMRLAAGQLEGEQPPFGVGSQVDFGRVAATRAPERFLTLIPPFTPAAC